MSRAEMALQTGARGHNHPPDHQHLHSHLHDGPQATDPGKRRDDDDLWPMR